MPAIWTPDQSAPFLPADSSIQFDLSGFGSNSRHVFKIEQSCGLSQEQIALFCAYASWQKLFPAIDDGRPSRTLFAVSDPDYQGADRFTVSGIKVKGIGGQEPQADGSSLLKGIAPLIPYGQAAQIHYGLNPELDFFITLPQLVNGRSVLTKALRALSTDGAENEFHCQNALSDLGLGFKGLAWGRYFDRATGQETLDFRQKSVGAVFSEFPANYVRLGDFIGFYVFNQPAAISFNQKTFEYNHDNLKQLLDNYQHYLGQLAEVKSKAAFRAGLLRHVGHTDNFLINKAGNDLKMTDLDSVLLMSRSKELAEGNISAGSQFLRDTANDLVRNLEQITLRGYSNLYLQILERGEIQPVYTFLSKMFSGFVNPQLIQTVAQSLTQLYCAHLKKVAPNLEYLKTMNDLRMQSDGKSGLNWSTILGNWHANHLDFTKQCLMHIYTLMHYSNLPPAFKIPKIKGDVLGHFSRGIEKYQQALFEESERQKAARAASQSQ